jgi:opacity protein-like surface antigen
LVFVFIAGAAAAQTRPVPRRPPPPAKPSISVRGFADIGSTLFSASKSFEAILGSSKGSVFGGGVEVLLPRDVFVNLRASRFSKTGERVFISNGQQFNLGIDTSIKITPLELMGGYRFVRPRWRVVPYGGAGVGWYQYEETSEFATDAENVKDRFTGFQVLGGAEFRIMRWIGAAGELEWATVPDAIGQDTNSVSHEFGDTNLGGVTFRVKVVIGR